MTKILMTLLAALLSTASFGSINLSISVYDKVPFSSQFIEDGTLIRNVNYKAVKGLVSQLEKKYKEDIQRNGGTGLTTRGEAHITTITPPEAQGWFNPDHKGINYLIGPIELHQKYFPVLQNTRFEVVCIGKQENNKGNLVFYLVVKAPELLTVRSEIQKELEQRALFTAKKTHFNANNFHPHITIGYVGGDVHGVSKGPETCIEDVTLTK